MEAAAASCNILHDTADTEHHYISHVFFLHQEFISGNTTLFHWFLKRERKLEPILPKNEILTSVQKAFQTTTFTQTSSSWYGVHV